MSYSKEYYQKNKERIKKKKKKYYLENKKEIDDRNKKYYKENKEEISNRYSEKYQENKEEYIEKFKAYYQENIEECKQRSRVYYQKNKEKHRETVKKWVKDNKEKYQKYRRDYMKNDRKRTPHIYAWRDLLKGTIKRMIYIKKEKTIDILGYSSLELKEHIENQFLIGMNWENYGTIWEIDHIKEVCFFDKNTPQNIVNSLDNIQPIWKDDNIKKYYKNKNGQESSKIFE